MIFFKYILILFVLVTIASCKKNKVELPPDVGYDYAPTAIGKYVIYDIDSVVFDEFVGGSYKYRIKEKLEENIIDAQGRPAIKLIRYFKKFDSLVSYDNIAWTLKDVWTCIKTQTTYEVVEEDIRFSKLIFPITIDKTWNGNAYNTLTPWDYKILNTDNAETINSTAFDNVLTIEQKDDKLKNIIHREYYIEKYAKGVGLIYREIKDLHAEIINALPIEKRIKYGIIYKQTYVSHGFE